MLTKEEFHQLLTEGPLLLDGATGSNLQKAGMPRGCCTEQWILDNPQALTDLQRQYAEAGSRVLYAPTFQAQPIALERANLADQTEKVNARLVQLTRSAAPGCLVAGNLTTLATFADSFDPENFDLLVENYSRQIRGLVDGGVDLLAAETLMYPLEAEAILTAAELEGVGTVMYSFTMQPDGALFSGQEAGPVLRELEEAGAVAVGFNCVAASPALPALVARLRRYVRGPLISKPNAGIPSVSPEGRAVYPMGAEEFARLQTEAAQMGAGLLGGCCGTTPAFLRELRRRLEAKN